MRTYKEQIEKKIRQQMGNRICGFTMDNCPDSSIFVQDGVCDCINMHFCVSYVH